MDNFVIQLVEKMNP